jgi:hypothetical protein
MSRLFLCSKCLLGKPEEEFDKDTKRKSFTCCKACESTKDKKQKSTIGQNSKEYYLNNRDKIKERTKTYYDNNKQTICEKIKTIYYDNNRELILQKKKEYYQKNIDKLKEKSKIHYEQKVKQISKLNTPTNQT